MPKSTHTPFAWCFSVVVLATFSHRVETLLQISAGFGGNTLQQGAGFLAFPVAFLMQFLQADEAGKALQLQRVQDGELRSMQMWLKMLGKASTQQPELPSVYSYCTPLMTAFSRRFSYRDGLKMHTSGCAANSFINEFI